MKDVEGRLELLQDVQPDLSTISDKPISATTSSATMKGKRKISQKMSSLLEVVAEIRRIGEFPDQEAVIEVASKMKTIDELEPKVKDMEARLTIMENTKTDMTTPVADSQKGC